MTQAKGPGRCSASGIGGIPCGSGMVARESENRNLIKIDRCDLRNCGFRIDCCRLAYSVRLKTAVHKLPMKFIGRLKAAIWRMERMELSSDCGFWTGGTLIGGPFASRPLAGDPLAGDPLAGNSLTGGRFGIASCRLMDQMRRGHPTSLWRGRQTFSYSCRLRRSRFLTGILRGVLSYN